MWKLTKVIIAILHTTKLHYCMTTTGHLQDLYDCYFSSSVLTWYILISNNKLFLSMNGCWMTTYKNGFGCSLTHIQRCVKYDSTWFGLSRILYLRMRNCYFCRICICSNIIVLILLSFVAISLACYKLNSFYFQF